MVADQNVRTSSGEEVLDALLSGIDRSLPVPAAVQIRGVIEYGILMGHLTPGTRLPTLREFARRADVAAMTIVNIYAKLKEAKLIETRGKAGTFVAELDAFPDRRTGSTARSTDCWRSAATSASRRHGSSNW